jgi:hypothetical protein
MFSANAKLVDITDGKISIGPAANAAATDGAVIGNIHLASGGAFIYGAAVDDFVNVKSDGVDVVAAGKTQATFAATTKVGVDENDSTFVQIDSDSVDIIEDVGGTDTTVASFGVSTTIGNTSGQHISIDANSIDIKTAANVTALSASSAGIVMSGSITATQGTIGGFKINNQELSASGLSISATDQRILVTGSNSVTDGNSVVIDGGDGVIQVSQSGEGVFDTGRTKAFTTTTFIEPQVFKPGSLRAIESSSFTVTAPTPTAENMNVTSNLAVGGTIETERLRVNSSDRSTPFTFLNEFNRFNAASNTDGAVRPTASFAAAQTTNYSGNAIDTNCHPAFVFSTDYFTELETDANSIGWVQNGSPPSGSNIFTIANKIRETGTNAPHFADGKFNMLGLETNLSGMHNTDHQNEYTFLQAKHSGSIRLQIQHDGDVVSKGNITAFGTTFLTVSDEREKKDIYTISESLDRILNLRPTKFTWKETDKQDVGFIAQEVEKIIPEVIETSRGFINTDDSKERKTIAYPKLVPYLVDTIQELTKRIEELEKKVK